MVTVGKCNKTKPLHLTLKRYYRSLHIVTVTSYYSKIVNSIVVAQEKNKHQPIIQCTDIKGLERRG